MYICTVPDCPCLSQAHAAHNMPSAMLRCPCCAMVPKQAKQGQKVTVSGEDSLGSHVVFPAQWEKSGRPALGKKANHEADLTHNLANHHPEEHCRGTSVQLSMPCHPWISFSAPDPRSQPTSPRPWPACRCRNDTYGR